MDPKQIQKFNQQVTKNDYSYCLLAPIVAVITYFVLKKMKIFVRDYNGVVVLDYPKIIGVSILMGIIVSTIKYFN